MFQPPGTGRLNQPVRCPYRIGQKPSKHFCANPQARPSSPFPSGEGPGVGAILLARRLGHAPARVHRHAIVHGGARLGCCCCKAAAIDAARVVTQQAVRAVQDTSSTQKYRTPTSATDVIPVWSRERASSLSKLYIMSPEFGSMSPEFGYVIDLDHSLHARTDLIL